MAKDNRASREVLLFYSEWSTLPSDIYLHLFDQNCVTWTLLATEEAGKSNTFSWAHCCSKQSRDTVNDQEREIHTEQATGSICHEPQLPTACLDHFSFFSKFCRYWALLDLNSSQQLQLVCSSSIGQKRPAWFNNSTCEKDLDLIVKSVRANRVMMLPKEVIRFQAALIEIQNQNKRKDGSALLYTCHIPPRALCSILDIPFK